MSRSCSSATGIIALMLLYTAACGDRTSGDASDAGFETGPDGAVDTMRPDSAPPCPAGQVLCGDLCVRLDRDREHCGSCAKACDPGHVCSAGSCALSCQVGLIECDRVCIDPFSDRSHCGATGDCIGTNAGTACAPGELCAQGSCTTVCPWGQLACGSGSLLRCVDPQTDPIHCGAALGGSCDSNSSASPDYQGATCAAGEACVTGSCTVQCPAGLTACNGACTNTGFDPNNCGGCGNSPTPGDHLCSSIEVCQVGACVPIKTWGAAELIANDVGAVESLQLAGDPAGNAIAVWSQPEATSSGTQYMLRASRFDANAKVWSSPQLVSASLQGKSRQPQLCSDINGNVVTVWRQRTPESYDRIYASHVTATTMGWTAPQLLSEQSIGAWSPQVSCAHNGDAVAAWFDSAGPQSAVHARRYRAANATWEPLQVLEIAGTGGYYYEPVAVANAPNGDSTLVWAQNTLAGMVLRASSLPNAKAAWEPAQTVATAANAYAESAQVVTGAGGNAVAVWRRTGGSAAVPATIWANQYNPVTSAWGTAQPLQQAPTHYAYPPALAADGAGHAMARWVEYGPTVARLWTNRFDMAGASWGTPSAVTALALFEKLQLDLNSSGDGMAVWEHYIGPDADVWASYCDQATGTCASPGAVESMPGHATQPQVAVDAAGNAIAVWLKEAGGTTRIWASRFR